MDPRHAQTLQQCEALRRLVFHLGQCGPDAQARQASRSLLQYFDGLACEPGQHPVLREEWAHLREEIAAIVAGQEAGTVLSDMDHFIGLNRSLLRH